MDQLQIYSPSLAEHRGEPQFILSAPNLPVIDLSQIILLSAKILGIELLLLPAYSPNLNLIERFWQFIKQDCLYSKYDKGFHKFKAAISMCIKNARDKNPDELESQLSWNFQFFSKTEISTV